MSTAGGDHPVTGVDRRRANLHPQAARKHGIYPLLERGELPATADGEFWRERLERYRGEAAAWIGGDDANVIDQGDAESFARWETAADIAWSLLAGQLTTPSRRRKALFDLWERCEQRARERRATLRDLKHEKRVGPLTIEDYAKAIRDSAALAGSSHDVGASREPGAASTSPSARDDDAPGGAQEA